MGSLNNSRYLGPAFSNSIRESPPDCSKALPLVPPYPRRSSGIYSQAVGTYSLDLPTPNSADYPILPLALSAPNSKTSRQLLSNPSPQDLSTTTKLVRLHGYGRKTDYNQYPDPISGLPQRPSALDPFDNTYQACSLSSMEVEPSTPVTTPDDHVYVEVEPAHSLLALVGARLERPFDPQIPYERNEGAGGSCPSSTGRFDCDGPRTPNQVVSVEGVIPGINTEEEAASALSSVYQSYFTETYKGKAMLLQDQLGVLSEAPAGAFSPTVLGPPPRTNGSLTRWHGRVGTTGKTRPRKANDLVQGVPRSLPEVPKGPFLMLEEYTPHSIRTRSDTVTCTWLNSEYSKLTALNAPSIERRPATVPSSSNPCATVWSLQAELDHTYNQGGSYESRFSIHTLEPATMATLYALQHPFTSFSRKALPSFLASIVLPRLKVRDKKQQVSSSTIPDDAPIPEKVEMELGDRKK
jgi:hypothetical protein